MIKGAVASKWSNPFEISTYGREHCLYLYEKYIKEQSVLYSDLEELVGKTLVCYCAPKNVMGIFCQNYCLKNFLQTGI